MVALAFEQKKKVRKGFAGMSPEKRREIASRGGKTVVNRHQLTSEERRRGGINGGVKSRRGPGKYPGELPRKMEQLV